MVQTIRSIIFSLGSAICLTLVAYFGLPATMILMLPGIWITIRIHVPDILGIPSPVIALIVAYSILIWLTVQLVHLTVSLSRRLALAWMRSRL
jgi:hypothetical protein